MKLYFNHRKLTDFLIALAIVSPSFQIYTDIAIFKQPTNELFVTICLMISTSAASLLGFVLAANSFLISHTQHRRLDLLRKSNGFIQLIDIMKSSLWRLFVLTLISGLSPLFGPSLYPSAMIAIAFVLVLSITALATLIWSTMAVLAVPLDNGRS